MVGNDHLDLPVGCTLQLDRTNPLFNDSGSMSLALTLPATARNERLLGYPSRIDVADRHDVHDGILADGSYIRNVKVNVISAGPDGIDINVGQDESCLYEQWADVKLRDVPELPVYEPDGGVTYLVQLMQQVYAGSVDLDYHIFPIAVEWADDEKGIRGTLLNTVHTDSGATVLDSASRSLPAGMDSEDTVTVPVGYGITPFLRVGRALHILLDAYGYTLEDNLFDTDPQLSHLVLLNNTADTICAGYIDYRDLLPDCTINELLDAIKAHFGACLLADSSSHTARIVFIRDVMDADADADWTSLHTASPKITFNAPKQLVLSSATGYLGTETECDDMDAFMDKYAAFIDTNKDGELIEGSATMRHDAFTQAIYTKADGANDKRFSSLCWGWHKRDKNLAEESYTAIDKMVPVYADRLSDDVNLHALPLYLSGVRNANTVIKTSSSVAADDTAEQTTDLALCFYAGRLSTHPTSYFGTPYPWMPDGTRITRDHVDWLYSLLYVGEDGAYNRWWKAYDAMLRNGNRTVEVGLRLNAGQVDGLTMDKPKTMFGQPMLVDTLSHPFPMGGAFDTTAVLRTMKSLSPASAVTVQDITKPLYYWSISSDLATVKASLLASVESWLASLYDDYEILNVTYDAYGHALPADTRLPTAAQVSQQATLTTTYTLRATVYYQYKERGFLHWEKGTGTRYSSADVTETRTATAY